jgi:membrane-anchored protein YejM (alkaline phosphatase superfamily)
MLVFRLCFVLFLYSLFRILFWSLHRSFFQEYSTSQSVNILIEGIRFDIVSILYFNLLYILSVFFIDKWAEKLLIPLFFIPNAIGLFISSAELAYFPFNLRRISWQTITELQNINNGGRLAMSFLLSYGWVILVFLAALLSLINFCKKTKPSVFVTYFHFRIDSLIFSSFIILMGLRGGSLAHAWRPIGLNHAGALVKSPQDQVLLTNTPFTIFKTISETKISEDHFFQNQNELEAIYSPLHNVGIKKSPDSLMRKMNVVILIVESLSAEATASGPISYTPFLDSLKKESISSKYTFANGKRSIEALPTILAGIPSLDMTYTLSQYAGNKMDALPTILGKEGYSSAFFHGAQNGSMGFDGFCKLAGFQQYFGKTEYNKDADFDGVWGIWDQPFLQFTADKISKLKSPFLATVFTLSSHDPFKVPQKYKNTFKKGKHPIYETLGYTDYALKQFFAKAKKQPWFKNTVFVITGDHTSSHANPGEFSSNPGRYRVPVIFYLSEKNTLRISPNSAIQQMDISPSILEILNYQKPYFSFGKNIFLEKNINFSINKLGDAYQWTENDYLLIFRNQKSEALYNFAEDSLLKNNLIEKEKALSQQMERNLKAFLQQYHNRIINNQTHLQ